MREDPAKMPNPILPAEDPAKIMNRVMPPEGALQSANPVPAQAEDATSDGETVS